MLDSNIIACGVGSTGHREWIQTPVELERKGADWMATVTIPDDSSAWFINARSGDLIISTDYEQAPALGGEGQRDGVALR